MNQVRTIGELAVVIPGFSPRPNERHKSGQYLLLGGRNISNGVLTTTGNDSYVDMIDRPSFHRAIAKPGDIIVSTLFDKRKLYWFRKVDPPSIVNASCAIIRAGGDSDYIVSYLRTLPGQQEFLGKATLATRGAVIPRITTKDLANIQIPILPVAELQRLGDASIEQASGSELFAIKRELESKDAEIERLRIENIDLVRFYEDRLQTVAEQIVTNTLATRIKLGETAHFEFKSSLRWNLKAQKVDRDMENSVLKAIVAFCNSAGGELLIGVADDGSIVGIEHDGFSNEDKFQLHLRDLLLERIVPSVVELVEYAMVVVGGKPICHVSCRQSKRKDIWLKPDKNSSESFYIRVGPSSTELSPRQALEYIREHFEVI